MAETTPPRWLPTECPNCGRIHGEEFVGPVETHLLNVVKAAMVLLDAYEEDRSDSASDGLNGAIQACVDAGYLTIASVATVTRARKGAL